MKQIRKEDISGTRVTNIHSLDQIIEGSEITSHYFTVDSGISFSLPYPGERWTVVEVPKQATIVVDEYWLYRRKFDLIQKIKEKTIESVYFPKLDPELGFYPPNEAMLVFTDLSYSYCVGYAPNGLPEGVFYVTKEQSALKRKELVDFFDIPVKDDDCQI